MHEHTPKGSRTGLAILAGLIALSAGGGALGLATDGRGRPANLVAAASIDERIVQLSGCKAERFEQLARHSTLASAAAALPLHDVYENDLLDLGRSRYSL